MAVFTDVQWNAMEPLIEAVRPQTGRELSNLRRTFAVVFWLLHDAKWGAIPAELGPWWMAAQTFLRWSKLGVMRHCSPGANVEPFGAAGGGHGLGGKCVVARPQSGPRRCTPQCQASTWA
jgi:hypothetical protein